MRLATVRNRWVLGGTTIAASVCLLAAAVGEQERSPDSYSPAELHEAMRIVGDSAYSVGAWSIEGHEGIEIVTDDERLLNAEDPSALLGVDVPVFVTYGIAVAQ